jgi:hypothetical protein
MVAHMQDEIQAQMQAQAAQMQEVIRACTQSVPAPAPTVNLPAASVQGTTPVPGRHTPTSSAGRSTSTGILHRIKLESFTGDSDITPWIGKAKRLAEIHDITDDDAKISYVHLHLAGKALAWFNDQKLSRFPTFLHLESALIKQYGISEAKRQKYRSELVSMEQKDKTVQEITQHFETLWTLAYPHEEQEATQYKLHNYLRILHHGISSMVGIQSPATYEEAKDLAIKIEAYLPRVPAARINTVKEEDPADREQKHLRDLIITTAQEQGEILQQTVAALALENTKRDQELAEMKRVLGRTRPPPQRSNPYPVPPPPYLPPPLTLPPPATGSNRQPMTTLERKERFKDTICHACGQTGHTKYYKGCTKHPEYKPNFIKNEHPLNDKRRSG